MGNLIVPKSHCLIVSGFDTLLTVKQNTKTNKRGTKMTQVARGYSEIITMFRNMQSKQKTHTKQWVIFEALIWAYTTARTPFKMEEIFRYHTLGQIAEFVQKIADNWDGNNYLSGAFTAAKNIIKDAEQLPLI